MSSDKLEKETRKSKILAVEGKKNSLQVFKKYFILIYEIEWSNTFVDSLIADSFSLSSAMTKFFFSEDFFFSWVGTSLLFQSILRFS